MDDAFVPVRRMAAGNRVEIELGQLLQPGGVLGPLSRLLG